MEPVISAPDLEVVLFVARDPHARPQGDQEVGGFFGGAVYYMRNRTCRCKVEDLGSTGMPMENMGAKLAKLKLWAKICGSEHDYLWLRAVTCHLQEAELLLWPRQPNSLYPVDPCPPI